MMRAAGAYGNANITGGTITGTNAPYFFAKSAIPFIKSSSGTMGNNGALSAITALPTTYTGAYIWLPANAIVAGSAAGWYWFVGSSTTAGTVYNSVYTTGIPTVGTTTAFATTGPGAFTGDTAAVTGPQYTLTGGAIGPNGLFRAYEKWTATNNANAKTKVTNFGGSAITGAISLASSLAWQDIQVVMNRGTAATQVVSVNAATVTGVGAGGASGLIFRTVNTAADITIARSMTGGTATDNIVLESFADEVAYGA
jgi:hypothetical protein